MKKYQRIKAMSVTKEQKQAVYDAAMEVFEKSEKMSTAPWKELDKMFNACRAAQKQKFVDGQLVVGQNGVPLLYRKELGDKYIHIPTTPELKHMHPTGIIRTFLDPEHETVTYFCVPVPRE